MGPCFKCCCCRVLWDGIICFPFAERGPVYPVQKEIRRRALRHLSLELSEFNWLSRRLLTYFGSFPVVRNLPQPPLAITVGSCCDCLIVLVDWQSLTNWVDFPLWTSREGTSLFQTHLHTLVLYILIFSLFIKAWEDDRTQMLIFRLRRI